MSKPKFSLVALATTLILGFAIILASNEVAYQLTSFGLKITNTQLSIHDILWYHMVFVPSLALGIRFGSLAFIAFSLFSVRNYHKTGKFSPKQFAVLLLVTLLVSMGTGLTAIPSIQANLTTTGSYYLDTPLPIADYYIGKYSNSSYFAINGSNWNNFQVSTNITDVTLNCLKANSTILYGSGQFNFQTGITITENGVHISGSGEEQTYWRLNDNANTSFIKIDANYTTVENLHIDHNGDNQDDGGISSAIWVGWGGVPDHDIHLQYLHIENYYYGGIEVEGQTGPPHAEPYNVWIEGCTIHNGTVYNCISVHLAHDVWILNNYLYNPQEFCIDIYSATKNIVVQGNILDAGTWSGDYKPCALGIEVGSVGTLLAPSYITVTGNMLLGGYRATYTGSGGNAHPMEHIVISDNVMHDYTGIGLYGMSFNNDAHQCENWIISGNTITGYGEAIKMFGSNKYMNIHDNDLENYNEIKCQNSTFADNILRRNSAAIGIVFYDSWNKITGNIVHNCTYGFSFDAACDYNYIVDNRFVDVYEGVQGDSIGTNSFCAYNHGYVTENTGSQIVANSENITHGLTATPVFASVTCCNATYDGNATIVSLNYTAFDATNIQVNVYWANGTAITDDVIYVMWEARTWNG